MNMDTHKRYMARCIELAQLGAGHVSPNPMVGCVIVHEGTIIGEGYHQKYGGAHAEVNAIQSVKNEDLLTKSTLYVTLEPCAHYGLTPPCSDLIVEKRIRRVVVGTVDPFAKVAGKGITKMMNAGIDVTVGILENECAGLNKRFFTFHEKRRPYVILKWAQTQDGFIDIHRTPENFGTPTWITGNESLLKVHRMRAEEDAIMVGTNTALKDNPSLTVRHCEGKNPVRVVLDRNLSLPKSLHIFDKSAKTLVFNSRVSIEKENVSYVKIDFEQDVVSQVLDELYRNNLLSLIVEGGQRLLQTFIDSGLWDEAWVFEGSKKFGNGISAPKLQGEIFSTETIGEDKLTVYKR